VLSWPIHTDDSRFVQADDVILCVEI